MTDKPIIYYKKDCFNEPYCSLGKVIEQLDQLKASKEQAEQKLEQIRQIVNKLSLSINWNINKNAYEKLQSIIQIIDEVK